MQLAWGFATDQQFRNTLSGTVPGFGDRRSVSAFPWGKAVNG